MINFFIISRNNKMCTPASSNYYRTPCGFSELPTKIINPEEIPSLSVEEKPFTEINFQRFDEFLDYLKFPVLTLPAGTVLCHSGHVNNIYTKTSGINLDNIYWWNEYYPGQKKYKGGWFTYETSYGGPDFGLNFYYRLKYDITLPFIPNYFREKYLTSDPKYFSEFHRYKNKIFLYNELRYAMLSIKTMLFEGTISKLNEALELIIKIIPDTEEEIEIKALSESLYSQNPKDVNSEVFLNLDKLILKLSVEYSDKIKTNPKYNSDFLHEYVRRFKGSHVIEGVENWEEKRYAALNHPRESYADQLGIKLAELGFNGYISCDECEIYITHAAMERVLTKPFNFDSDKITDPRLEKIVSASFHLPDIRMAVTQVKSRQKQANGLHYADIDDFYQLINYPEKFT